MATYYVANGGTAANKAAGTYDAVLIVRDSTNTNGIRFGTVSITVVDDDEASE